MLHLYSKTSQVYAIPDIDLVLTSSISGRNACPSEKVTFICTAQGPAVFWRNEAFGERAMHYTSPPSRGEFRAEIVSYDRNQSCLVSSLSFRATASRNGTTVTCISRNRSFSQSLSLHIMSSESVFHLLAKLYAFNNKYMYGNIHMNFHLSICIFPYPFSSLKK